MSNPCEGKVKSTGASKMASISGSAKNYEHTGDKAERFCNGGYAAGGPVQLPPKDQTRYGDGSGGNELGYGAVRKADGGDVKDNHTIRYGWQRNTQPDGTRIDTPSWGKPKE